MSLSPLKMHGEKEFAMCHVLELTVALDVAVLGLCFIAAMGIALLIWRNPCIKL